MADLLVIGSLALDTLEGPFGTVVDEPGGSALYFSLAASLIHPVRMSAPVGVADGRQLEELTVGRDIDLSLVSHLDAPTYRWRARHAHGQNIDLGSRDSIYDRWVPELPEAYDGWAFIGSMRPRLQADVADSLASAALLAGDAMQSYASGALLEVEVLVERCDWFFGNAFELELLAPALDPQEFRVQRSLEGLCVKAGERGSTIYTDQAVISVPAVHGHPVVDTTGAGDALAGGFLARWLQLDRRHDAIEEALRYGTACASLTIEDIGVRSLARATPADLAARLEEVGG